MPNHVASFNCVRHPASRAVSTSLGLVPPLRGAFSSSKRPDDAQFKVIDRQTRYNFPLQMNHRGQPNWPTLLGGNLRVTLPCLPRPAPASHPRLLRP